VVIDGVVGGRPFEVTRGNGNVMPAEALLIGTPIGSHDKYIHKYIPRESTLMNDKISEMNER
jgi:hypothetical protein